MDKNAPVTRQNANAATRMSRHGSRSAVLGMVLLLCACGGRPTEDVLPGGIPARIDLHAASKLPPESVRTVARREYGWRLIYHPARAPVAAEQGAARALCGLERRGVNRIERIPRIDQYADPGAAIIDVYCS